MDLQEKPHRHHREVHNKTKKPFLYSIGGRMKKATAQQKEEMAIGSLAIEGESWTLSELSRWLELQSHIDSLREDVRGNYLAEFFMQTSSADPQ